MSSDSPTLAYRLLTGPSDRTFCERVSEAMRDGYVLFGDPSVVVHDGQLIAAQAVVRKEQTP